MQCIFTVKHLNAYCLNPTKNKVDRKMKKSLVYVILFTQLLLNSENLFSQDDQTPRLSEKEPEGALKEFGRKSGMKNYGGL